MAYYPVDWRKAVIKECHRRRNSERTAEAYIFWIGKFFDFCGKGINEVSKRDVRLFLEKLDERKLAGSTLNVCHMALRFLFEEVLDKRIWIDIKYSKIPEKIQRYLEKDEMIELMKAITNQKHRIMIGLIYSAGLRVSELINLKIEDLHVEKGYGFVRNGKGGKDRIFVVAERIKNALRCICENRNLEENVFISERGRKYSIRTIQKIVKDAAKKAGIENWKEIHPHTLRHSFATHLIENNYAITDVQASLGHKSPETSMIYTHSSGKMIGIKSPLDNL